MGGCANKVTIESLRNILSSIRSQNRPNELIHIGLDEPDDAAILNVENLTSLSVSCDSVAYFGSSYHVFGQMVFQHAINDIFAIGSTPKYFLLNLGLSRIINDSDIDMILKGIMDGANNSGLSCIGGHSYYSDITTVGITVLGEANKNQWSLNNAKNGDKLILLKRIGVGMLINMLSLGELEASEFDKIIETHNLWKTYSPLKSLLESQVSCATDISGYGLLWHITEISKSSNLTADISMEKIRESLIPHTERGFTSDFRSGLSYSIQNELKTLGDLSGLSSKDLAILTDPQTNGSLLLSVSAASVFEIRNICKSHEIEYFEIGEMISKNGSLYEIY